MYRIDVFETQVRKKGFMLTQAQLKKGEDGQHYVQFGISTIEKADLEILWNKEGKAYSRHLSEKNPCTNIGYFNNQEYAVTIQDTYKREKSFDIDFSACKE